MHHTMKSLLLIFVLVTWSECISLAQDDKCPDYDVIYPCECSHYGTESSLSCHGDLNDTSVEGLQKILKSVSNAPSMDLGLYGYKLGKVPSKLFEGLNIRELILGSNEIHSFESKDGSPVFSGLEDKLMELQVYDSIREPYIYNFNWKLDHLRKLQSLKFYRNRHEKLYYKKYWKVSNDWFKSGPASLNIVTLDSNGIESLGDSIFASLTNLQELSATDNEIKVIQRSMFPDPANKFVHLDFSKNSISTLSGDIFSNMPSLEIVVFRYNQLATLDQHVWEPVWNQLEELYFGEYLTCDSSINWVFTLKRPSKLEAPCSNYEGDSNKRGKQLKDLIDKRTSRLLL